MLQLRVDELLAERGKNINWLSHELNMSHNKAALIARSQTCQVRFSTLDKLCLIFNCSVSDLFKEVT